MQYFTQVIDIKSENEPLLPFWNHVSRAYSDSPSATQTDPVFFRPSVGLLLNVPAAAVAAVPSHLGSSHTPLQSGAHDLLWVSKSLGVRPEHDSQSPSPENTEPYLKVYSLFI